MLNFDVLHEVVGSDMQVLSIWNDDHFTLRRTKQEKRDASLADKAGVAVVTRTMS
jgi:hypothetical protein